MRNRRNINRQSAESLVRDGFLPPQVLAECGSEDGLLLDQTNDVEANRLWLDQGTIFVAVAVHLSNLGSYDRIVAECCCELEWANHVELLEKSEEDYSRIFVAGREEFARSAVLNASILGARVPKCGGSLDGTLIFKAYGLPTRQQVTPKMTARLNVVFTNGLELAAQATVRVQGIDGLLRVLPAQPVVAATHVEAPAIRRRRPLFNVGKE